MLGNFSFVAYMMVLHRAIRLEGDFFSTLREGGQGVRSEGHIPTPLGRGLQGLGGIGIKLSPPKQASVERWQVSFGAC